MQVRKVAGAMVRAGLWVAASTALVHCFFYADLKAYNMGKL